MASPNGMRTQPPDRRRNAGTALAEERLTELESELEQDEHPVDYDAELETEEEEAAPVSEKRLKREIRAESIRRLEEAPALKAISGWLWTNGTSWTGTGSAGNGITKTSVRVPLEYQAVSEPKLIPRG